MSEDEKANCFLKKQFPMRALVALCLLLLLLPLIVKAYNINPSQVAVVSGGKMSSYSYRITVGIGQPVVGKMRSPSYITQIGWIYTLVNNPPNVGQIQLCDGTCGLSKTVDPATELTVKVIVTDPNGQGDVNTESFHVELYTDSDTNGSSEDWDHNNLELLTDPISLGTANGCTQIGSTYCITLPSTIWTTKFLNGDANIFIRVDDNSSAQDFNFLTAGALVVNAITSRSEDSTSGTYSAAPNTANNAITTDQTNTYVISTHNGNTDINVTVTGSDITTIYFTIEDGNQSWHLTNVVGESTPFTGGADTVKSNWGRGTDPTSATQNVYYYLDIPDQQPAGDYTSTLTYNSTSS